MNPLTELDTQIPELDDLLDFAVIGAGMAGLTAASNISGLGYKLAVFEKARGTGGRLSSKRVAYDEGEFMAFDLGCTSITAQSAAFYQQIESWHLNGVLAPWCKDDQGLTHYVAVPRNSGLTRHLSKHIECHFSTRITSIQRIDNIWHLFTGDSVKKLLAKTKNVIIATPAAQAYDLLPQDNRFKNQLKSVEVAAQWVMGLEISNDVSATAALQYPNSASIYSISQESRKPGRRDNDDHSDSANSYSSTILQVQASPLWTQQHLESSHEQVSSALISEIEQYMQQPLSIINAYVHRWLYSCVTQGIAARDGYLWDEEGLGLIGDYLKSEDSSNYAGIESAWLSGKNLSDWLTLDSKRDD